MISTLKSNQGPFTLLTVAGVALLAATAVRADDAPVKVTAKQLTADFVKDKEAAAKKYGDSMNPKEVIVEGTVASLEDGKYGKIAKLEGEGKVTVSILLRKEDVDSVKKGDTIKGKCRGLFEKDKLVDINGGVLVKEK
jgi:hypothetical protein